MKKTIKRKRKDMRVYKDETGNLSIVNVVYDGKNNIIGIGDIEMAVGKDFQSLKIQLLAMFKATRLDTIHYESLEKIK